MPGRQSVQRYRPATMRSADTAPLSVQGQQTFGFLLVPQFSMISLSALLEPLRMANWIAGRELYRWELFSRDGAPVAASNGLTLSPIAPMEVIERVNALFVVAGDDTASHCNRDMDALLRRLDRRGIPLGATSTGSLLLAHAGLLDGHRCTIHWALLSSLRESYTRLRASPALFQIDGPRMTCSGGIAGLDMMLHLIAEHHGPRLANAVSDQCIHAQIRPAHGRQRMALRHRLGISHPDLLAAVSCMETQLEEPLPLSRLADEIGLSLRQLERLFRAQLGATPARYYLQLRLVRARELLQQTSMPVVEVGVACGFATASHFGRCYRQHYGRTPRQERADA